MLEIEKGDTGLYYGHDPSFATCLFAGTSEEEVRSCYEAAITAYCTASLQDELLEQGGSCELIDMRTAVRNHIWAQCVDVGRPGHVPDQNTMTPEQWEETSKRLAMIYISCAPSKGSA